MVGRKKKSKKRSAASSKQQPKETVYYLDRNLGSKVIPEMLRAAKIPVEIHDDHLPANAPDEDWIALVGRKKWIAITKDRNIQFRYSEHIAIVDSKAMIMVIRAKDITGDQCGEILIRFHKKIERYIEKNRAPFLAGIDRYGKITEYPLNS